MCGGTEERLRKCDIGLAAWWLPRSDAVRNAGTKREAGENRHGITSEIFEFATKIF